MQRTYECYDFKDDQVEGRADKLPRLGDVIRSWRESVSDGPMSDHPLPVLKEEDVNLCREISTVHFKIDTFNR
jgi:hypothetical protein